MNLLVLSWRDPKHPLAGGAEQVMHQHMKGWKNAGHSVTLFSSKFLGASEEEVIDGVTVIRSGGQYIGVQLAAFFYYLKNKNKYDLLIDQFHGIPFFTPLYSLKPKIAIIHETAREVWFLNLLHFPLNLVVGLIGYLSEPIIFLFYKKILFMTGSKSTKGDLIKLGIPSQNIKVIPHGFIIKKPTRMPNKEKIFTITFLGILSKDKGIEDAIHCFYLLSSKTQFQFWIIGRSETQKYENKIRKLVLRLGLKNKVKLWGFVSEPKKVQLLTKSHLLINPSIREGWGLVNIEANSLGTPVVAYKSLGLIDSIKHRQSGLICQKNNSQNLADNILKLFRDQRKYKKLQLGAVRWSKNFSWTKASKESLSLIEKVHNYSFGGADQ